MALCSLQEKLGFQVLICHVNHELRGEEAAQDEAYVEMLCHKMQVPFFAFHENVELIAKNGKKLDEVKKKLAVELAIGVVIFGFVWIAGMIFSISKKVI